MRSGTARPEVAQRKAIMTEQRIDQFFLMHSARADTWRAVMTAAEGWAAGQKGQSRLSIPH